MYDQISANKRRTFYLFFVFCLAVIGLGWVFSQVYNNQAILIIAVGIAVIQSWVSYFYADAIALATSKAVEAPREQFIELHRVVENLAITAGLPKPKVYIINDPAPNAFATGRDAAHASMAVTSGLLAIMDKDELQGVLAHELSHIANRDILVMTVVVTLVGTIVLAADIFTRSLWWGGMGRDRRDSNNDNGQIFLIIGIVLAILAPIFAQLIQLAISRKREYLADASGALLTRYPEGLASALEKLEQYERPMISANRATAHMFINEPYGNPDNHKTSWLATITSTHPPLEDRIKKLRAMA